MSQQVASDLFSSTLTPPLFQEGNPMALQSLKRTLQESLADSERPWHLTQQLCNDAGETNPAIIRRFYLMNAGRYPQYFDDLAVDPIGFELTKRIQEARTDLGMDCGELIKAMQQEGGLD